MNKKLITLILLVLAQTSIFAQDMVYSESTGSNSCCSSRCQKPTTCCPRTYSKKTCCPKQTCGRRWTGSQRWRNCCGPTVRKCRPKRTCCPRLRCCRPRPACCPPVAPVCEAAPCLTGNGDVIYDENGSFIEEAGIPTQATAAPLMSAPAPAEMAVEDEEDSL